MPRESYDILEERGFEVLHIAVPSRQILGVLRVDHASDLQCAVVGSVHRSPWPSGPLVHQQQSVSLSFPQLGSSVPAPSYYKRDGVGHHFYGYRLTIGFAWQPI
jgi:hypothetical protein